MRPRARTARLLPAALLLLGLPAAELSAQSFTIDFEDILPAGDGVAIASSYASIGTLSITNRARNGFGAGTVNGGLCRWHDNYGDLQQIAYTCSSAAGVGEFTLTPLAGYQLTIHSFQIGEYQGRIAGDAETRIYGLGHTDPPLFSATQALVGGTHWTLTPELTTTTGFNLQWGDNWDYGIDNISITVAPLVPTAAPEPASMALLGLGLAVLGVGARARARRAAS
jgi:hypothetical protein